MRIASVADVKAKFSGYIEASKAGPVVVTKNGKPVAVLLSMQDEDELERTLMAYSPKLQQILENAERQIQAGQGIAHEDLWRAIKTEVPCLARPLVDCDRAESRLYGLGFQTPHSNASLFPW